MKTIIFTLLLSGIILTGCTPSEKYPKPDCLAEKIDIETLFSTKNYSNEGRVVIADKGSGQFPQYSYWEENLKTKDVIKYLGSKGKVIYKWKFNRNDTIIELSEFYANGSLKQRYWQHTGKITFLKDDFFQYEYKNEIKIGKEYNYKDDCALASVTDYDSIFKFSLKDVEKLMKGYDASKKSISREKEHKTDTYFWQVHYKDKKSGEWMELIIDPLTGKIIESGKIEVMEVGSNRGDILD